MRPLAIAGAVALLSSVTSVQAEGVGDQRLSFGVTTYGPSVEYAYRFRNNFSMRGVAGGLYSINETVDISGESYDASGTPQGVGLMIDYHTGLAGLRVSGGAFYSNGSVTAVTTQTGVFEYGGTTFVGTDTVTTRITQNNEIAPALSIGYDQPIGDRFVLSAELGGVFNGGYTVSATSTPGGLIATNDPTALTSEVAEVQREVDDTLNFYPYVALMFGVRF